MLSPHDESRPDRGGWSCSTARRACKKGKSMPSTTSAPVESRRVGPRAFRQADAQREQELCSSSSTRRLRGAASFRPRRGAPDRGRPPGRGRRPGSTNQHNPNDLLRPEERPPQLRRAEAQAQTRKPKPSRGRRPNREPPGRKKDMRAVGGRWRRLGDRLRRGRGPAGGARAGRSRYRSSSPSTTSRS